jgi:hypothetical protein
LGFVLLQNVVRVMPIGIFSQQTIAELINPTLADQI